MAKDPFAGFGESVASSGGGGGIFGNFETPSKAKAAPKNEEKKKKKKVIEKAPEKSVLQNIQDFTASANQASFGAGAKELATAVNAVATGFNKKETEKRTKDFLKSTGQTDNKSAFALNNSIDKKSTASKAGDVSGTVGKVITDVASLIIPATAVEKGVKGLGLVSKLGQTGKAGKVASKVLPHAGGSVAATGVGAAQDVSKGNEQNLGKNAAIGTAADIALPVAGKVLTKSVKGIYKATSHSRIQKAADDRVAKFTNDDGTVDVHSMMEAERAVADAKHKTGPLRNVKNALADNVNALGFARAIDQVKAKQLGVDYKNLPAEQSLERQVQISRNVEPILRSNAEEKLSTGLSFKDLNKKLPSNSAKGKEFGDYTLAVDELHRRDNGLVSRLDKNTISDDSLKKSIADFETKNKDARTLLKTKNEFYTKAATFLHEGGVISKKELDDIVASSDVASPFNRIFADKEALAPKNFGGSRTGSIAKQTAIKGVKGGTEPLDTSLEVVVQRVRKGLEQKHTNIVANMLKDAVEGRRVSGNVIQEGATKNAKAAARAQRQELNKHVRVLGGKLSLASRDQRKIETELNNLNKKGLHLSLKSGGKESLPNFTPGGLGGDIPTGKTPVSGTDIIVDGKGVATGNIEKRIDSLSKRRDAAKAEADRLFGLKVEKDSNGMIPVRGNEAAVAAARRANEAQKTINKLVKQTKGNTQFDPTHSPQLGKSDTRKFLNNLVESDISDLTKVRNKIAVREPKLAAQIDKVIGYRQRIDAEKTLASEAKIAELGYKIDKTTGKAYISGLDNGELFRVELPPRIINSLDKLSRSELPGALKVVSAMNKVFKATWVGVAAPAFVIKSATWDLAMVAHNSPRGLRTLGPDAVLASLKGMWESDGFIKQIRRQGATPVGASELGVNHRMSAESLSATRNLLTRVKFGASNPQAFIDSLDIFGGKLAALGRTRAARAEFKASLRSGATKKEAYARAAQAYDNVLPDFNTMTPVIRSINAIFPFTNASIAGTRSLAQAYKRSPKMTIAKTAALTVAPAITIASYNMQSDSGIEYYRDMMAAGNELNLDNNLTIVLPGAHKDDKTGKWSGVWKIPVSPEFRAINSQAWRTLYGKNDAQHMARDTFDFVTGGIRTLDNPQIDIVKIMAGQDPRSGDRLVKGKISDKAVADQSYDFTSASGKALSGIINTGSRLFGGKDIASPIQGDAILGQFGAAGSATKKGKVVEGYTESFKNSYEGAFGEKASSAFFSAYSPLRSKQETVRAEVKSLRKAGKWNQADRVAAEFNNSIEDKFSSFNEKYKSSDAYDSGWDELKKNLVISRAYKE